MIAAIAIPVALQNFLTTTGSMIDTMMLASLGEKNVGAVGLCAQFSSLMFSCYWGFVGGGMLFFVQFWGAGDKDGIRRSYVWLKQQFIPLYSGVSARCHGRECKRTGVIRWQAMPSAKCVRIILE